MSFSLFYRAVVLVTFLPSILTFQPSSQSTTTRSISSSSSTTTTTTTSLNALGRNYVPKWKKKETLEKGENAEDVGLVGTVPVVFKQGNTTKTTMAIPGQPLSDVAIQAGQFIKYGCGKGECGTCESLCNGQWVRPCSTNVPTDLQPGEQLVLTIKETKQKGKSSGKFYSARSFIMGAYNNILGMVGFVREKKYASDNWNNRKEYESLIAQRVAEKKAARKAEREAAKKTAAAAEQK